MMSSGAFYTVRLQRATRSFNRLKNKTFQSARGLFGDPDEKFTARNASGEDVCVMKQTEFLEYVSCAYANILNLDWKAHFPLYITLVFAILVVLKFFKTTPIITKKAAREYHSLVTLIVIFFF